MPILRPYQIDLVQQVEEALKQYSRVMVQAPTGAGKTECAIVLAQKLKAKAIVVAHRKELIDQIHYRFRSNGLSTYPSNSSAAIGKIIDNKQIPVVSNVSLSNALRRHKLGKKLSKEWLLIIDEAHHVPAKSYRTILEAFPGKVIGITATPWRLKYNEGFEKEFETLITCVGDRELQRQGYLVPPKIIIPNKLLEVLPKLRAGEFALSDEYIDLTKSALLQDPVNWWVKNYKSNPIPTLIYASTIKHAQKIGSLFRDKDISTGLLVSDTEAMNLVNKDKSRKEIVDQFRQGVIDILINCEIVTEGFDVPEVGLAMVLRPTHSLSLWRQMCGRALRPAKNKVEGLIYDATCNTWRLGRPDKDVNWSLKSRGVREEEELLEDTPNIPKVEVIKVSPNTQIYLDPTLELWNECSIDPIDSHIWIQSIQSIRDTMFDYGTVPIVDPALYKGRKFKMGDIAVSNCFCVEQWKGARLTYHNHLLQVESVIATLPLSPVFKSVLIVTPCDDEEADEWNKRCETCREGTSPYFKFYKVEGIAGAWRIISNCSCASETKVEVNRRDGKTASLHLGEITDIVYGDKFLYMINKRRKH